MSWTKHGAARFVGVGATKRWRTPPKNSGYVHGSQWDNAAAPELLGKDLGATNNMQLVALVQENKQQQQHEVAKLRGAMEILRRGKVAEDDRNGRPDC